MRRESRLIETSLSERPDQLDKVPTLEMAELALAKARKAEGNSDGAAGWGYREAALAADYALRSAGDEATRARLAEIHGLAIKRCLRLLELDRTKNHDEIVERLATVGLELKYANPHWTGLTFTRLLPCSDYEVRNIEPVVKRDGWGLPVLAERVYEEDEVRPAVEEFYAKDNRLTCTLTLRPLVPFDGSWQDLQGVPAELVMHGPLDVETVETGAGVPMPLAADFTTPSLVQFGQSGLQAIEYEGLLLPDLVQVKSSIFLNEPYRPGKIPVVFVHGLWSSPRTWTDMNNALLNDPEIRHNYQFFFALYPTGESVLESARILREKIQQIRDTFDPGEQDPAWDQMVVVCHSMGGIVSRLLITDSGDTFERSFFKVPLDEVKIPDEFKEKLRSRLFFESVPEISRVVFLAPVFRGSSFASRPVGRISSALVRAPDDVQKIRVELIRNNQLDVLQPELKRLRIINGIDNLQPTSPVLLAMEKTRPNPTKRFHIVLGDNGRLVPRLRGQITDGLVTYESGHLDGAESELIVAGNHYLNHDVPVIEEVARILKQHLGLPVVGGEIAGRDVGVGVKR